VFDPSRTAVVVIDMINHQLDPDRGMLATLGAGGAKLDYFVERVERETIPNHAELLTACRAHGVRVAYTRIGGFRRDGADLGANVRGISNWGARADADDCEVIDALAPEPGDISVIKTGSGSFTTSSLDLHLRNMGVESVLYTGVITNGCVMLTALAGYDLGYRGLLVTDCTATLSQRAQEIGEQILEGFTERLVTTSEVVDFLTTGIDPPVRPRTSPTAAFPD
jgi:nicotinamidase-related amidase